MELFEHQGQAIAFIRKGAGQPIVFLHNAGTSHAIWQNQIDALSTRHEVFAVDLPGYGRSSPSITGYSLDAYTDALGNFIVANIGHQRITLVGNCMGSAISLNYATKNPSRVQSLVLINPLTRTTFSEGDCSVLFDIKQHFPVFTDKLSNVLKRISIPGIAVTPGIFLQVGKRGRQQRLWKNSQLRECYENPNGMAALVGLYNELPHYSVLDDFIPSENFPNIYTVWGEQNRVLSARAGQQLNISLNPKEATLLTDCGHLLMMERPEVVTRIIEMACAGNEAQVTNMTCPI